MPWKDQDARRRYNRDYNRAHRASLNASQRAYDKRRRVTLRQGVFDRGEGRCHLCGVGLIFDHVWHIDHVIPRSAGGRDDITNYLPACEPCNVFKKANHHDIDENDTSFMFGANVHLVAFEDDYRLLDEVSLSPPLASEMSVD